MNFTDSKITEIYYLVDDFCKEFDNNLSTKIIGKRHKRPPILDHSEVISFMILFHDKGYKCMKHFYTQYVQVLLKHLFPKTVSYNRFVELMKAVNLHFSIFIKTLCLGECTGISYIDSTQLGFVKTNASVVTKCLVE